MSYFNNWPVYKVRKCLRGALHQCRLLRVGVLAAGGIEPVNTFYEV
jgi:hypothetical protein